MALTFCADATPAAFGGLWRVRLNRGGRYVAVAVFRVLGIGLFFPHLAEAFPRTLVRAGSRPQGGRSTENSVGKSFILGISTGLLWAPCAEPILGLILTGAAIQGSGVDSLFLLMFYALGAATSLGIASFAGKEVFTSMKRSLRFDTWMRSGLGIAVILGVMAIALGWHPNLLTKFSFVNRTKAEENLLHAVGPTKPAPNALNAANLTADLNDGGPMPGLSGTTSWLNSEPLRAESLRGGIVLIDFWTYSCINCLRAIRCVEAWAANYKDAGQVVIGVHTPKR